MRSIRLTEASPKLHRQTFATVMSTPVVEYGKTLREHLEGLGSSEGLAWDEILRGLNYPYYQRLSTIAQAGGLRDRDVMGTLMSSAALLARPLLMIQQDFNWQQRRRDITEQLESTLIDMGYESEALERQMSTLKYASNWNDGLIRFSSWQGNPPFRTYVYPFRRTAPPHSLYGRVRASKNAISPIAIRKVVL